ncbi:MAG: porin family protein [Paracoccus sp. (in: a-proteobacteria)]|nr:porin family protein [Paracoccus sp. (in: a-proteobacteria)]
MKKFAMTTVAASVIAGSALAGGYVEPVAAPVTVTPIVAPASPSDWSGFYAGLQYGKGSGDLSLNNETESSDFKAYGLHAGYMHDFGNFVLGGELDYNKLDIDNVDDKGDMTRLRARAGYDLGRVLPYVTLGAARISADVSGYDIKETAVTYGIGADFKVTERFVVGAEYSKQDFSDVADTNGLDLDSDMVQLRASFRF